MRSKLLVASAISLIAMGCSGAKTDENYETAKLAVSAVRSTNKFFGTVSITNDPATGAGAILSANTQNYGCNISASSTSISGVSSSTTAASNSFVCSYEMAAETEDGGITYRLDASRFGLAFDAIASSVLEPKASQPNGVEANFSQCLGLAQVKFLDGCNGDVEYVPEGLYYSYTTITNLNDPADPGKYVVLPADKKTTVTAYFRTGSDSSSDLFTTSKQFDVTPSCNEIQTIVITNDACAPCQASDPTCDLGRINGPFEIAGETMTSYLQMYVADGVNYRTYYDQTAPYEHPESTPADWWTLQNLLPGDYTYLQAYGGLRSGYEYTTFYAGINDTFSVAASSTLTPSRNVSGVTVYPFVMNPGFVSGLIDLKQPGFPVANQAMPRGSFDALVRGADPSRIQANGLPQWNSPASFSSINGNGYGGNVGMGSSTSFAGTFSDSNQSFTSSYELPVISPYDDSRSFYSYLQLTYNSAANGFTGLNDTWFRHGSMTITSPDSNVTTAGGTRSVVDYEACMNEVVVNVELLDGDTMFAPVVSFSGGFDGFDDNFAKNLKYSVSGNFQGQANTAALASTATTVGMPAPRGSYTVRPSATVISSSGNQSSVNFSPFNLELKGCGSVVEVNEFIVDLDLGGSCAGADSTAATAKITRRDQSQNLAVERAWYIVTRSDGTSSNQINLCGAANQAACGIDPDLSFTIPTSLLGGCGNSIQVFATSANVSSTESKTAASLIYNVPADGVVCAGGCPVIGTSQSACVQGTEKVKIGDRSVIDSSVSAGSLYLGVNASITQDAKVSDSSLLTYNDTELRNNSTIVGTLTYDGGLHREPGSTVGTLDPTSPVTVASLPVRSLVVGNGDIYVNNGANETLGLPGSGLGVGPFGNVTVRARATLTVYPGSYAFNTLTIEPDAKVVLMTDTGNIIFEVQGHAKLESRVAWTNSNPDKFFVYSNADIHLHPGVVDFPGSVIAPNGEVHVYSNNKVEGCVQGRILTIEPDSRIFGRGASLPGGSTTGTTLPNCHDGVQNGTESSIDCGGSCGACSLGDVCRADSDCSNLHCISGICATPAAGSVTTELKITSDWATGYCAQAIVKNAGTVSVDNWTVNLHLTDSTIAHSSYGGSFSGDTGEVMVGAVSYNTSIPAGQSTQFGFCASKSSATGSVILN